MGPGGGKGKRRAGVQTLCSGKEKPSPLSPGAPDSSKQGVVKVGERDALPTAGGDAGATKSGATLLEDNHMGTNGKAPTPVTNWPSNPCWAG